MVTSDQPGYERLRWILFRTKERWHYPSCSPAWRLFAQSSRLHLHENLTEAKTTMDRQAPLAEEMPRLGCSRCRDTAGLEFDIQMAFQPIVDLSTRSVYAYEALVRGMQGESAGEILGRIGPDQLYSFDQTCRVVAIETAARLGMQERLSINFLPRAVYEPAACIRLTLDAAVRAGFATDQLIFEFSEKEPIKDPAHTLRIVRYYRSRNILTAFDDFGAGYAGLGLLADFQPDLIKLDMHLVRAIDASIPRQQIVHSLVELCRALSVKVVAEGIETADELACLRDLGITLVQGYWIARPEIARLPSIHRAVWDGDHGSRIDENAGER